MNFDPYPGQQLTINNVVYFVVEHPSAPGMPFGQSGRTATVYKVKAQDQAFALKVFFPRFRTPSLVLLAEQIASFASLPGLQVCQRTVLTPRRHADLLATFPDLTYSVLMPWVDGHTWMEILLQKKPLSTQQSLDLARCLVDILVTMEERGMAHCDLSAPNLLLNLKESGAAALVDVEGMYAPGLKEPEAVPSGSAGYAHKLAGAGIWNRQADRFAGAVLMGEILGWCDSAVCQESWGESYFEPQELQKNNSRYNTLIGALHRYWGEGIASLFTRAWQSETLSDCPTFGEWLAVLPKSSLQSSSQIPVTSPPISDVANVLFLAGRRLEGQNNLSGALDIYREAQAAAAPTSVIANQIREAINRVQNQSRVSEKPREVDPVLEIDRLFDQARQAIRNTKWLEAKELLAEVIRLQPGYQKNGESANKLLEQVNFHLPQDQLQKRTGGLTYLFVFLAIIVVGFILWGIYQVTAKSAPTPQPNLQSTATVFRTAAGLLEPTVIPATARPTSIPPTKTNTSVPPTSTPLPTSTPNTAPTAIGGGDSMLAFFSSRDGNDEIYSINVDGSNLSRLTKANGFDKVPVWKPDGKKITYSSTRDGNWDIWLMDPDGSNQQKLTQDGAEKYPYAWSADGKALVYTSRATSDSGYFDIYTIRTDGTGRTRLTSGPSLETGASWSPDGTKLAYISILSNGKSAEIHIINSNGSGDRLIASDASVITSSNVDWSKDGLKLLYSDSKNQLRTIELDGSKPVVLTSSGNNFTPKWSPDGKMIAFTSNRDGNNEIYIMNADGSNQRRLTSNQLNDELPSWRPTSIEFNILDNAKNFPLQNSQTYDKDQGESDDNTFTWSNINGKRRAELKVSNCGSWWFWGSDISGEKFYISEEIQLVRGPNGTVYSQMFRRTGNDHYLFSIKDNQFAVINYNKDQWIFLIDWTTTNVIKPGQANKLSIVGEGNLFYFYINDQFVGKVKDDTYPRGVIGIHLGGCPTNQSAIFEFDNYEFRAP